MINESRIRRLDQHQRRRGVLVIAALAALAIVSMIMLGAIPRALRERHEAKFHERIIQARYVCDAGIDGAMSRWKANPSYKGGEMSIDLTEESGLGGLIKIDVSNDGTHTLITVRAEVKTLSGQATNSLYDHPVVCNRTLKLRNQSQE
jgi:type II secretory pathway pseudopilin PulG